MIKSQSRSEQFYTRSGSESTKGSRKGFTLLDEGDCPLSVMNQKQKDEAARHALNTRIAELNKQLAPIKSALHGMRFKYGRQWDDLMSARKTIKDEMHELLLQVQGINVRVRMNDPKPSASGVPEAFVDVAREILTAAQFKILMKAAFDRVNSK